jgi:pyruvate dehydrogenase E2 component (dihydrolipoamide acetyltransferase)
MLASLHSMAQLTLSTEADVTDLVTRRQAAKGTPRVTYTHLLLRATAVALRRHPRLNALVQDGEIRECRDIHIGIAVPIQDGVIVPVVRHVDRMSLLEIVKAADDVVGQVQAGGASPDLVRGSTFTISNLGSFGIDAFTPIINPPEVAILGVGRITDRPIRLGDNTAWRQVINLSLTVDHRAVDGVPAAQFLQTLTEQLAHPEALFP